MNVVKEAKQIHSVRMDHWQEVHIVHHCGFCQRADHVSENQQVAEQSMH